jgi:hypothetical protein
MADIGYCYGSEYQLLRFLGHHRNWLDEKIKKLFNLTDEVLWFDYPLNINNLSWDGESTGIEFLQGHPQFEEISRKWKKFWPQTGSPQNWDSICKIDDTYLLIEAKARLGEVNSDTQASEKSINIMQQSFNTTREHYKIITDSNWTKTYYQMANRIAFIYFLNSCGIKAKLLNIYFLNGYERRIRIKKDKCSILTLKESISVKSKSEWLNTIKKEYDYLGCNNFVKNDIGSLFIDCFNID